ncbi:hypothetical protein PTSG_12598 [Salpingoeca rosetta]|uniref:Reverse transcriptase n=1 Tax=Salpingoeca rosetta (strain ATCC 50818 / BSB-021) TaxID=946362 RepID=F2UGZ1_SALR5|nr:uncharacterized protein PTSG_12598 [Salpingoeca rosetta]EGD76390.1 hypothetical protein PTSG_12598 [Salpingoeca rosetta]|eukprot:XP_004991305.1 hypothetical protein PTSG_12598 [Salpingoeca rosetta]
MPRSTPSVSSANAINAPRLQEDAKPCVSDLVAKLVDKPFDNLEWFANLCKLYGSHPMDNLKYAIPKTNDDSFSRIALDFCQEHADTAQASTEDKDKLWQVFLNTCSARFAPRCDWSRHMDIAHLEIRTDEDHAAYSERARSLLANVNPELHVVCTYLAGFHDTRLQLFISDKQPKTLHDAIILVDRYFSIVRSKRRHDTASSDLKRSKRFPPQQPPRSHQPRMRNRRPKQHQLRKLPPCSRCGRTNHVVSDCHARRHVNGKQLDGPTATNTVRVNPTQAGAELHDASHVPPPPPPRPLPRVDPAESVSQLTESVKQIGIVEDMQFDEEGRPVTVVSVNACTRNSSLISTNVLFCNKRLRALVDTGAERSLCKLSNFSETRPGAKLTLALADGSTSTTDRYATGKIEWCGHVTSMCLPAVKDLSVDLLLASGHSLFTSLDLKSAYHQVRLKPKARELTAFFAPEEGHRPIEKQLDPVLHWPLPKTAHDLRQFLGAANYYKKYIRNYSDYVGTKKNSKKRLSNWTQDDSRIFNNLKATMAKLPTLCPTLDLDPTEPLDLFTDSSDKAVGAVLQHKGRPIEFYSSTLSVHERNWPIRQKELYAVIKALQHWRYLCIGRPITVYTDHKSLERVLAQNKIQEARIQRWSLFLSDFNVTFKYIPGDKNVVADALSRTCMVRELLEDETVNIRWSDYLKDPFWEKVIHDLASFPQYKRVGDLLYHKNRICVPSSSHKSVMAMAHDGLSSGHQGVSKSQARAAREFYWPGMHSAIREYVDTCHTCATAKSGRRLKVPTQALPVAPYPWHTVTMDLMVGLPTTSQGHDAIYVFVDKYSKMVHLAPTSSTVDAQGCISLFIQHVYKLHGLPEVLISDRDPRFTAALFRKVMHKQSPVLPDELMDRLAKIQHEASSNLQQHFDKASSSEHIEPPFREGDEVYVSTHLLRNEDAKYRSNKLTPPYDGPFKIKNVLGPAHYRVDFSPLKVRIHDVINIKFLKRTKGTRSVHRPGPLQGFSDDVYAMERILRHRKHRGRLEYLVKWLGYPEYEATYVQAKDMIGSRCKRLLAEYQLQTAKADAAKERSLKRRSQKSNARHIRSKTSKR